MSEFIHNDPKREKLKTIVKKLHSGDSPEKLKKDFAKVIKGTSPEEIADMEQSLLDEGVPFEEVRQLCDVHVEVFDATLKKVKRSSKVPGHPIYSYLEENRETRKRIKKLVTLAKKLQRHADIKDSFKTEWQAFHELEKHYQRKENQLFPALEHKNFTGPSKVMWSKHDDIRANIKEIDLASEAGNSTAVLKGIRELRGRIRKMLFMEEKILLPTAEKKLNDQEWARIKQGEPEIGYAWITPSNLWDSHIATGKLSPGTAPVKNTGGLLSLNEGIMTLDQINLMLTHLPFDVTFVDENDRVKFYTASEHRVFPRSPEIIGRDVRNCHPPKSVHIVEKILKAFKEGRKKEAPFWIRMGEQLVYINYYPIFDENGKYRGVIEVSKEISELQKLEGEKRLLDWEDE